jgi:hypothetical protein
MAAVSTTPSLAARERELLYFGDDPWTEAPSDADLLVVGRQSGPLDRAYEGFLRLPVAMVVGALWLLGMALLSAGALLLYLIAASLLQATE